MKTAQDYMNANASGEAMSGFNRRIYGESYADTFRHAQFCDFRDLYSGWVLADNMVRDGKIYSVHNFHNSHGECSGHAFIYGGEWVCNTCGHSNLRRPWWIIKVYRDGDLWCCVGEGFENLQESSNYAFGATREEAIKNYGDVIADRGAEGGEMSVDAIQIDREHMLTRR